MTITESRQREGTFTLGTSPDEFEVGCQSTSVAVEPQYTEGEDVEEVLCGGTTSADTSRGNDKLKLTTIQDWSDPLGFSKYCYTHDLEVQPYTWKPTGATGPTFSGMVLIKAALVGGDVGKRLKSELEWDCVGQYLWTDAVVVADAAAAGEAGPRKRATS